MKQENAFYVGYLSLPSRHRAFLMFAVPLTLIGMVIGAIGLASDQSPWGEGFWQTGQASTFEGTLTLEPYPMLHIAGDPEPESLLLVEMGKFGTAGRFEATPELDGASVSIRGRELTRAGRRMIEIDPDSAELGDSVAVLGAEHPATPIRRDRPGEGGSEPITMQGEILDSKCYLGAMKPGAGRGHRACAILCIRGGIPPMLRVQNGAAAPSYWLLTDATGLGIRGAALEAVVQMIGTTVELRGRPGRVGSWRTFALEAATAE